APPGVRGGEAADEWPERERERADRRPQADRPGALPPVLERRDDDRERGGHQQRRAESLRGAAGDQHTPAARQPGRERGEREHRQANEEQPAPAVDIGEPAADQHETGEDQDIPADHPLQARHRQVQAALDRGIATLVTLLSRKVLGCRWLRRWLPWTQRASGSGSAPETSTRKTSYRIT